MSVSVLVMGQRKNGKSTFINALIGESLLPARATSCTALVTEIGYGNDTEHIKVFYKDSDTIAIMPKERYVEEFVYPEEEVDSLCEKQTEAQEKAQKKWEAISNAKNSISHIEMQTKNAFFPGGFKVIDTPELPYRYYEQLELGGYFPCVDASAYRYSDWVMSEYLPKANAIVFLLNATALFSTGEKENIEKNFAGKHLRNVFFVVNRVNQIMGSLEENVIPCVRNGLSAVFTDENGRFDEDLFQKRVFYVNAYGALCARTGEPYKILVGRKEIEIPIGIEETGFPEFESALWQYLRSCVGYGRK